MCSFTVYMKKYFIGMMILSTMLMLNTQIAQAKGNNGKVGTKQESTIVEKKHPVAKAKRDGQQNANVNSDMGAKRHGIKGANKNSNVSSNKRLEGKEKAIERRLDGKEKTIQKHSKTGDNSKLRRHRGHGQHKRNVNNSNIQQRHTNRGNLINSQNNSNNNLKQEKKKKYIKQNGTKTKPIRNKK